MYIQVPQVALNLVVFYSGRGFTCPGPHLAVHPLGRGEERGCQ